MTPDPAISAPQHANVSAGASVPTIEVGRIMAAALADAAADDDRLALARSFGARLVAAWWQALGRRVGRERALRDPLAPFQTALLSDAAIALAESLAATLATRPADMAAYDIGSIYTSMLPRSYRAAHGIYYTPPVLTDRLIAQATETGVDWATCRVLDPACGGGAFLAPIARRIIAALPDCSPRILVKSIANRLRGYEVDPFGAWLAQVTFDAVLAPLVDGAKPALPAVVNVCDSLNKVAPNQRFDLVIGNPPYGRVRLDPETRSRYRRSLFGHANLYGLFTDLAIRHTRAGGVVAYVTPTSFLAGEYYKSLRGLIGRDAPPATLDFVAERKGVFADVLQETLLATYRRGGPAAAVHVHEIAPVNGERLTIKDAGRYSLPTDPTRPWILPRCMTQAPLVSVLAGFRHRLKDWGYTVSTGPLVWNRYKTQLTDRPGQNRYPLIWAEAITADGQFIWRADKKNHTLYFEIKAADHWLMTTSRCVLLQRTTAKEQRRRLIAAALPTNFIDRHGAIVVENHLNMLRPLNHRPPVSATVLAAFLNSAAADRAFRCLNGSVAVSAYELEALPLPPPEDLLALAALCRARASRARIEAECSRLFDERT